MSILLKSCGNFAAKIILSLILFSLITPSEQATQGISCRGRKDGKYADSKDCYHFLQCFGGVQFMSKCPRGHVFDKYSFKCETSIDIPCNATKTQKPLVGTHCHVEGEIKPSVVLCERFLVCRNGLNYPIYCPPGLIFSNKAYKCILAPDPCATDSASKNKKKENDLIKREKSPYIGICDNKISQNITEPLHCTLYIQCMMNPTKNTTIVYISACGLGLLYSRETNQCEKPEVVWCGERYRNKQMYGRDPNPKDIYRFLAERNKANNSIDSREKASTVEPESTTPSQNLGRGFFGPGGDSNTGGSHGVGNLDQKGHRIVLHDFGSKTNDSSESFIVKIILNNKRHIEKTSILGRNGTHNHIVIEEQSSGETPGAAKTAVVVVPIPNTPANNAAERRVTTEEIYDDDITTIVPVLPANPPTTTQKPVQKELGIFAKNVSYDEEAYDDDTTVAPKNDENKMKAPAANATNAGVPGNATEATNGEYNAINNETEMARAIQIAETRDYDVEQDYYYYDETDTEYGISDSVENRNGKSSNPKSTRTLAPRKLQPMT